MEARPIPVQPQLTIMLDISGARAQVKKVVRAADEANRELARLEDRLAELEARLANAGIHLEVINGS
jgi:transcription elongation GreA/GreB family factor